MNGRLTLVAALALATTSPLLAQEPVQLASGPDDAAAVESASQDGVCCTIVSMNHRLGRGKATNHLTGEEVAFHLKKRSLANRMKEGELLRIDEAGQALTLYSPEACCAAVGAPDVGEASEAIGLVDCCSVLSFEGATGQGKARVRATGETFDFYQTNSIFTGMEAGDRLWIDPESGEVGVARDLACCVID